MRGGTLVRRDAAGDTSVTLFDDMNRCLVGWLAPERAASAPEGELPDLRALLSVDEFAALKQQLLCVRPWQTEEITIE